MIADTSVSAWANIELQCFIFPNFKAELRPIRNNLAIKIVSFRGINETFFTSVHRNVATAETETQTRIEP